MTYRADIDGLRSIAVLLVLIFHFNLLGLGEGGFIGVDVFFVISGYLISSIIWRELREGRFGLGHFYLKRIRRLAPALIAVQLAVLALAAVALLPNEMVGLAKESMAAQLYLSNLYYWRSLNYFGVHVNGAFLLHTWSLGVEEQFYLFFPLVLMLVHRVLPRRLTLALAVLCLASFALNIALVGEKPQATFYLLPMRAWEMMAGALVARIEPWFAGRAVLRQVAGPIAAALIVVALAIYTPFVAFPGWFALLPVVAAALFLIAGTGAGSVASRLLAMRVPVWFGRISYPLYLVHWPIRIFAETLLPNYGPSVRWAMFALSIGAAWAIYRGVEQRVRVGAWFRPDRRILAAYVGSLVLILGLVGSAITTGGWRGRFSPDVLRVADIASAYDPVELNLDYGGGPIEPFLRPIGAPGITPRWLIVGDSHAGAMAQAASLWLSARGEAGLIAFHNGCLPVLDTGDAMCRSFTRATLDFVATHPEIGSVMLVSIWRQPIEPGFTDASGRGVAGSEAIRAFDVALHGTLDHLHALGVRTYVWEPLPAMPASVPEMMARNLLFDAYRDPSASLADHRATFAFLHDALAKDAPLIAGRISALDALCRRGRCVASDDGRPLFEDSNHPSIASAPYFAAILARQMAQAPPATGR